MAAPVQIELPVSYTAVQPANTEDTAIASPDISDFYHLANQLEHDRDLSLEQRRLRDREIGRSCEGAADDWTRLQHWLHSVDPQAQRRPEWASRANPAVLLNLLALCGGFAAMAGLLLGSANALVNVLFWLLLFVGLQGLLMAGSLLVLLQLLWGRVPPASPVQPIRFVLQRRWPDARALREAQPLLRLLFLRHGQALGALFAAGAAAAFLVLPAVDNYGFVWGSTYPLSDPFMQALVDALAWPWHSLLPGATIAPELLSSSRYHAALQLLDAERLERMRGWWGFLMLCLLVYSLLPRVLLYLLSRALYRRQLLASLLSYPGVERVLARMQAPLVATGAAPEAGVTVPGKTRAGEPGVDAAPVAWPRTLLLEVAGAFGEQAPASYEELADGQPAQHAGIAGSDLATDRRTLAALRLADIDRLYLAVKGWEPPVAELADLLEPLFGIPQCSVLLVPLPGRPLPHRKVEDWRLFARAMPFQTVDVQLLNPVVIS
ncbi:DUF2868 domain-containing protein [Haliea sp.]|uniref:DUF2868 domain-containing protein n=1 Tax=Haliea sp. TaxID=1932666 RepID=UPI0025BBCA18|nr:DUF2868 domain-containing protein [Haliea sp.]|tara:strand:- start:20813 stop:22288 length:1476 start_codon:yes stop_codon:yes gene_type:complete